LGILAMFYMNIVLPELFNFMGKKLLDLVQLLLDLTNAIASGNMPRKAVAYMGGTQLGDILLTQQ
jgi:hypothetical protein